MMTTVSAAGILVLLATAGMSSLEPRSTGPTEPHYPCYGSTSDWRAWTERNPRSGRRELVVTGTVTTPTGNNRRSLVAGPVTLTTPPDQFVDLHIKGIGNIATAMVLTKEVRGRFPALAAYGAVIITCNGDQIGRVQTIGRRD